MNQRFPSVKLSNRTLNTTCFLVEKVTLAMPDVMRVVDGSPRNRANCAAAPMKDPADGFDPMTGAATIILSPGGFSGGGSLCRHARIRSGRSVSSAAAVVAAGSWAQTVD